MKVRNLIEFSADRFAKIIKLFRRASAEESSALLQILVADERLKFISAVIDERGKIKVVELAEEVDRAGISAPKSKTDGRVVAAKGRGVT